MTSSDALLKKIERAEDVLYDEVRRKLVPDR